MSSRGLAALPLALMALMALPAPALAAVKAGEREIEIYTVYRSPRHFLRAQLGLSYGLSDHLSVVLFGVLTNRPTDARKLKSLKLQGRYRFSENFKLPLELGVQLEYELPLVAGEMGEIDGRILLGKALGRYALAGTLMIEKELAAARPFEFSATLGGTYTLSRALRLGVESRYVRIGAGDRFYVGPTAALFLGGTRLSAGLYYGGNHETQGRLNIGQKF